VSENAVPLPDFTRWPSFPFEGDIRIKPLDEPVDVEPPRHGEDGSDCVACNTPDEAYIWVSERWRVRAMDRPTGLPMVLILESRSHLDLGDLPNLLAAELGVMTVRLERAVRSLDGVARVHVNRWGDGAAHLHLWFLARPYGRLQLRGTFLSLWDDILPQIRENQWRENLALVAAWLAEFGGRAIAEPPHIQWQSPSTISTVPPPIDPDWETASAAGEIGDEDQEAAAHTHASLPEAGPGTDEAGGVDGSGAPGGTPSDSRMRPERAEDEGQEKAAEVGNENAATTAPGAFTMEIGTPPVHVAPSDAGVEVTRTDPAERDAETVTRRP
jgi:diadenosine tetraphosphate (Ap4A) HIT family hydrolase